VVAVQALDQAGHPGGLDIQAVGRQVHDGKVHRDGRVDILAADLLGLPAQPRLQAAAGGTLRILVPRFGGQQQPVEVLGGELGVNRQQRTLRTLHRHQQRELHHVVAVLPQLAVGLVGARGQHVVQQRPQVHLPPAAARLHVGEDALEVADLRRHGLNVGDGLLHLGELVHHALEAAVDAAFDRLLQSLADAALDVGQALGRLLAHLAQLLLHQRPGVAAVAGQGGQERAQGMLQLQPGLLGAGGQGAFGVGQARAGGLRLRALPGCALLGQQQQVLQRLRPRRAAQQQQD